MKKPNSQQTRQRQRQKVSRKTIVIICAFSLSCVVMGLTIFFNMSHVDQTHASINNLIMVDEQTFTTEKTMEAPVIAQPRAINSKTVFAKKIKVTASHQ